MKISREELDALILKAKAQERKKILSYLRMRAIAVEPLVPEGKISEDDYGNCEYQSLHIPLMVLYEVELHFKHYEPSYGEDEGA